MKPTAALTALLLSFAPAHALIVHPDIWFGSDNGNIRCGGYPQYISGVVCEIHRSENNIQPHTARPEACGNGDWHYRFAIDDQGEARAFCVNDRLRHLGAASLHPACRTASPAKTPTDTASRSPAKGNRFSRGC